MQKRRCYWAARGGDLPLRTWFKVRKSDPLIVLHEDQMACSRWVRTSDLDRAARSGTQRLTYWSDQERGAVSFAFIQRRGR